MQRVRLGKGIGIGALSVIALSVMSIVLRVRIAEAAEKQTKADTNACYINMRQVAMGMQTYFYERGEKFDLTPLSYKDKAMPEISRLMANKGFFHCPADKGAPGSNSYSYNTNLNGHTMAETNLETVMVYEGKDGKLDFRHDGFALVAFADGYTELINMSRAEHLRWKP